jgi:hypothetical protein
MPSFRNRVALLLLALAIAAAWAYARLRERRERTGRAPPYPQARAEIMVGELPLAPGRGRVPESPDEIGIGPETAREIGWLPAGG